jgi:mRNA interferase RelE/StbE
MEIAYRKTAMKRLLRMQPKRANLIRKALEAVAAEPSGSHSNLKPLTGVPGGFRIRIGDWRISFLLDFDAERIDVFEIEPRGGAYRW